MKKVLLMILIMPNIASAASVVDFIDASYSLINNILLPIAYSLCILYFFWGVVKYLKAGAEGEKSTEGRQIMYRGAIALFVAVSIWGIIAFIRSELALPNVQNVEIAA